jgi:hypothetical protein
MRIQTGTKVKLTKINHLDEASYTNEEAAKQIAGEFSNGINTGYCMVGVLLTEVLVGNSIRLARSSRNGEDVPGLSNTSPVTKIKQVGESNVEINTANSVYQLEILEE